MFNDSVKWDLIKENPLRKIDQPKIKRHELKKITLHGTRHTSATLMISYDTDIRTVVERFDYSDANTTIRVYSHHLKKANKNQLNILKISSKKLKLLF